MQTAFFQTTYLTTLFTTQIAPLFLIDSDLLSEWGKAIV